MSKYNNKTLSEMSIIVSNLENDIKKLQKELQIARAEHNIAKNNIFEHIYLITDKEESNKEKTRLDKLTIEKINQETMPNKINKN